ncbi:hypothetical protein AQUCO_00500574v1 [Aquilegia coerulea]|uniref:F-box domain-containing protein n=1 Tax=Aquilegia coerulea TaxID=218851 RepID=A0A2G5ESR1_AQUCA|nr:hypothetical protein AQUCO_00500574v1 [Aquilegia coerulea]
MKNKLCCSSTSSSQEQNSIVEDRLTSLPEPIRNYIVSFLPIEDSVKLTVLSTQWRNISSSLSSLKFYQSHFLDMTKGEDTDFRNLVDRLLINHDSSNVTIFCLSVQVDDEIITDLHLNSWITFDDEIITDLHLNSWITFAVKHNVQDFFLSLLSREVYKLPCAFFSCDTLTAPSIAYCHIFS